MANSSSSSLNALKLLQERFAPGNSSDILSEEKMMLHSGDEIRRKAPKDKRPGRPKGSVNKKKSACGKGHKTTKASKLDSSDNDDDNIYGHEASEEPSYYSKNHLHYSKHRSNPTNMNCNDPPSHHQAPQQPFLFDSPDCRYPSTGSSYEQIQDHMRKNPCGGPRRGYRGPPLPHHHPASAGNGYHHMPAFRKREQEFNHPQYNNFRQQGMYAAYNPGPNYATSSPRQRCYFPPHPEIIRGWHPLRCPSWGTDYPGPHPGMYHPYAGYAPPPPIHSSKTLDAPPPPAPPTYFIKPLETPHQVYQPSSKKAKISLSYSLPPPLTGPAGQVREDSSLGPDLEEAIASIQSEEDDGSNQLVEEVIAFVDGKKKSKSSNGKNTFIRTSDDVPNSSQVIDENGYLKDCSRDPVLTATSGFVIPVTVTADDNDRTNGNIEDIVNNESPILNGNLSSDASAETIFDEENLRLIFENNFESQLCPHKSVLELPPVPPTEQAKDQLKIVTLQAQLGYILAGLLGYGKLNSDYDYSRSSVHHILHKILAQSNIKAVEENYLCSQDCEGLLASLDKRELYLRIIKLRLHVIRANIGKLLCICVPHRNEWKKFQWDGLTIDQILDNLANEDIPSDHDLILGEVSNELRDAETGEPTVYLMEINEENDILQALESGGEIEIQNEEIST